jgi:(p)ppGpp synthase/HD superfamily hydrolase
MEKVLEQITAFADKAHGNQQRKYSPERYIVHPIRVMQLCKQHHQPLPVLAAALLHDVLEDTPVKEADIQQFLTPLMSEAETNETVALVVELTDVYVKEQYPQWNRKKRKLKEADRIERTSAASQTVKYADIIDNCREIVDHDPEFANRFLRECRALLKRMPKGDAALYKEAKATVQACIAKLNER